LTSGEETQNIRPPMSIAASSGVLPASSTRLGKMAVAVTRRPSAVVLTVEAQPVAIRSDRGSKSRCMWIGMAYSSDEAA
jgi:hypothetical protein